ncbi:MAG: hypothetical protein R3A78_12220 [Polyangiales bacterium]|nr:hypothetical protein [Myxococcales bacterium]
MSRDGRAGQLSIWVGGALAVAAIAVITYALWLLRGRDWMGSVLAGGTGLLLMRGAVELFRPSWGE